MPTKLDQIAREIAQTHHYDLEAPVLIGGKYSSVVEHNGVAYISGQIPRIGSNVVAVGRVGESVSLEQAQRAATICALRVLAILSQTYGLERVERLLKLQVYVQSAADFTQQSEVADAASDVFAAVFGAKGTHARTSVGVYQLPKNVPVELDLTLSLR